MLNSEEKNSIANTREDRAINVEMNWNFFAVSLVSVKLTRQKRFIGFVETTLEWVNIISSVYIVKVNKK